MSNSWLLQESLGLINQTLLVDPDVKALEHLVEGSPVSLITKLLPSEFFRSIAAFLPVSNQPKVASQICLGNAGRFIPAAQVYARRNIDAQAWSLGGNGI